jgi:transposase
VSSRKKYSAELRARAARMFVEIREQHPSEWAAMRAVAELLGVGHPERVKGWVRQTEIDEGARPGVTFGAASAATPPPSRRPATPTTRR